MTDLQEIGQLVRGASSNGVANAAAASVAQLQSTLSSLDINDKVEKIEGEFMLARLQISKVKTDLHIVISVNMRFTIWRSCIFRFLYVCFWSSFGKSLLCFKMALL